MNFRSRPWAVKVAQWCGAVLLLVFVGLWGGYFYLLTMFKNIQDLESRLSEVSGLNVDLRSPKLSLQGVNPTFFFQSIDLTIANHNVIPEAWASTDSLLSLQNVRVQIKLFESFVNLRPVLHFFSVDNLALLVKENMKDGWRIKWTDFFEKGNLDSAIFSDSFMKIAGLQVKNADLKFERFDKSSMVFENANIVVSNSGDGGLIHLNAETPELDRPVMLSYEGSRFSETGLSGEFYAKFPEGDYTKFFNLISIKDPVFGEVNINEFVGGAEFWLELRGGHIWDGVFDYDFSKVEIENKEITTFENLSSAVSFEKSLPLSSPASWRFFFQDFSIQWKESSWPKANLWVSYYEGDSLAGSRVELSADQIDIGSLVEFTNLNFSFNPKTRDQLINLAPKGILRNFTVQISDNQESSAPLNSELFLSVKTNLDDLSINSAGAVPEVGGVTGFLSIDYDLKKKKFFGDASIESQNFRLGLPNTFTRLWEYEYVNGEVGFTVDLSNSLSVNILSNIVHLRSDNTTGKLKFRSRIIPNAEGNPINDLELAVGVSLMDVEDRSLYLPNGPKISKNLKESMEWVEEALKDGVLADSGILYRGSTVKDSDPALKTFQGFYRISDGVMSYNKDWPLVTEIDGFVLTADDQTDIKIETGKTKGLSLSDTVGSIRILENTAGNESKTSLLKIEGIANGRTQSGFEFISTSPLDINFKRVISDWSVDGQFRSRIAVETILDNLESGLDVRAEVEVSGNTLRSTKLPLQFDSLSGDVVFDTKFGVEKTEVSGLISEEAITFMFDSDRRADNVLSNIMISATGVMPSAKLRRILEPESFLGGLLATSEGSFEYDAVLSLPQNSVAREPQLELTSFLRGVSLNLPPPFGKYKAEALKTNINFLFGPAQQTVRGTVGSDVAVDLNLEDGRFRSGVIGVGDTPLQLLSSLKDSTNGLAIVGQLDELRVETWQQFFNDFSINTLNSKQETDDSMASFAQQFSFVDLFVRDFNVYGEKFSNVNLHIEGDLDEREWSIGLDSLRLAGTVAIPFDTDDYLRIDLGRLGFQNETNQSGPMLRDSNILMERDTDRLALIDPRRLPKLEFSTRELFFGDKSFGNWKFTINPRESGASFTDLAFNFRGLSLGEELMPDIPPAQFDWDFDEAGHESHLFGTLRIDDIADVLTENGFAPSLESSNGEFVTDIRWPGSPLYFSSKYLSGSIKTKIEDGRFLQGGGASGALKLISILNFDDFMRRLSFSGDLRRKGLAYEFIEGDFVLEQGVVDIQDRLVISGPSSLYQITGEVDLKEETIDGEMYLTLPVSENIPWLGLLTSNIPLAVGAYLFDQIFGDEVSSLTSAIYTLNGNWEGLEPQFKQAFGSLDDSDLISDGVISE